jgi:hypothetical protein
LQIMVPARVELSDTIRVRAQAQDDEFGSGIVRVGVVVRDAAAEGGPAVTFTHELAAAASAEHEFSIPVALLPGPASARQRSLTFVAFAIDQADNCTAVGAAGVPVACSVVGGQPVLQNVPGAGASTTVTDTRTFRQAAPTAAHIGDLVVDVPRRSVYISNQSNNSVDAISWAQPTLNRTGRAFVGAAPRGLTINNDGTQVIVANSGGTSLSYVGLAGAFQEVSRYETQNAVLYQLTGELRIDTTFVPVGDEIIAIIDTTITSLTAFTDFNDRPQFVAQDAAGIVFYSTPGAVRRIEHDPTWRLPEAGIMLWPQVVRRNAWGPGSPPTPCYDPVTLENVLPCVITYVDSINVVSHQSSPFMGTTWDVWAHPLGEPDAPFRIRSNSLYHIENELRNRGADPFMYFGEWDYSFWQTGTTTFVTSSGDRNWVNVADGEAGRVWNWGAIAGPRPRLFDRLISNFVNIADYVNNTASAITAVATNLDGSVFVTRNATSVFFFNNPLRILGSYDLADIAGGMGVGIHPAARLGTAAAGNPTADWVAAGSAGPEIVLIETRHFRRAGTIPLLEPVAGPMRVIQRLDTDPADIVAHIFGVTQSGAVFHVPVRTTYFTP